MVQGRAEMRALLDRHGLAPRRALGQHFLADPNIIHKIVAVAGVGPLSKVLEIGVGTGTLTAALAATGAQVVGVEVDRSLAPLHDEVFSGLENVNIHYQDALTTDYGRLLMDEGWVLVANLPYNVGTPIILELLRGVPVIGRMVVMVQLEVARRLTARPGSGVYGIPSVVVGLHAQARIAFRVPATVFVPPPKVESAVVVIERTDADPLSERAIDLAASCFGQRRKMLRRSLAGVVDDPTAVLMDAGIDPTVRPEQLAPEDWLRLAEVVDG